MPSLEEVLQRQTTERRARIEARAFDLRAKQAIAEKMQALRLDPNWEAFCNHLEPIRQLREDAVASLVKRLTNDFLSPQDYGVAFGRKEYSRGYADALTMAVRLIDALINQGAEAATKLVEEVTNA